MPSWVIFSSKKAHDNLPSQSQPLLIDTTVSQEPSTITNSRSQNELANSLLLNVSTHSSDRDIINTVSAVNAVASSSTTSSPPKPPKPKSSTHKCICCGTNLKVPNSLSYFKCAVCDTFYDAQSAPEEPVVPLTLEMVEDAVEKDTQLISQRIQENQLDCSQHSFKNLEELVSRSFSSVNTLNKSFPIGLKKISFSRPNIDFEDVDTFYTILTSIPSSSPFKTLLQATLALLKRPRKTLNSPQDTFFLHIILENPIFKSHSLFSTICSKLHKAAKPEKPAKSEKRLADFPKKWSSRALKSITNTYSSYKPTDEKPGDNHGFEITPEIAELSIEILERCIAIISNTSKGLRHYYLNWFSRYQIDQFTPKIEILNAFISYRLSFLSNLSESGKWNEPLHFLDNISRSAAPRKLDISPGAPQNEETLIDAEYPLDPEMFPSSITSTEIGSSSLPLEGRPLAVPESKSKRKRSFSKVKVNSYGHDWRLIAFARVQAIFFNANIITNKVPISLFYNTIVDYIDIKSDFDAWEKLAMSMKQQKRTSLIIDNNFGSSAPLFAFCEYPFLLSMGAKKNILEYDAKRQMAHKAHEAFFTSLNTHTPQQMYLLVKVRRNHLLHDSFQVFEDQEDHLKKSIKVQFIGEPGIDVGGLRKEWFLLLIRELVSPECGLFTVAEESGYTWFKTGSKQPLKYYKLTGVALGLALYNSTILDISFPPVLYKKLLGVPYTLDDFKAINPSFGRSLQQLLDYKGSDVEDVFCLTFSVSKEVDGRVIEDDLIPDGSNIPVTRSNRQEYVKQMVAYHLGTSARRMFEPLKQGFFKVVGSNALTLFQPEEVELLIRGSEEPINVDALRAVTRYNHWSSRYKNPDQDAQVVNWFWRYFKALDLAMQHKLLMFVTGSDRIPATGVSTMQFTITRAGGNCDRYPVSHTCFNELCLYEYDSKQKLVNMLTRAISDSEGFGLK